jgi:oligoendopeptidase F
MITESTVENLPIERTFIPKQLQIKTWSDIKSYYEDLLNRQIKNKEDLVQWLTDRSELEAAVQEDIAWRYIKMSRDTTNKELQESFNYFISEIEPHISPYTNKLNKILLSCNAVSELTERGMEIMLRSIKKQIEIFREENIPLFAELQKKEQEYAGIAAAMTVEHDGKEITLQQASNILKDVNREKRKEIYQKISTRRLKDKDILDDLFDELLVMRHQIALNAGFDNYRDYMFAALGRFDYTKEDCFRFHESIATEVIPLVRELHNQRKSELNYDNLYPWDLDVDVTGKGALVPFHGQEEIMSKTIKCFEKVHPFLGRCMETLRDLKHVDLDSRKGKAPGGFNYPLYESGVPYIFMNSSNSLRDLVTIVHEGGHAIHSIVTRDLKYVEYKNTPSEVAELASMSMELISMEHWDDFFDDKEDLKRAKTKHLESILSSLPWIAAIDKFQHWLYTNPGHSREQRRDEWNNIMKEFSSNVINREGNEEAFSYSWQKQLHLYQVPFYYIEYGMAQLGAIAIWKNYKQNPELTLSQYLDALKLGYTTDIGSIYKTAGIRFDFSLKYIQELVQFVRLQIENQGKA